jgi:hypothetical protein
MDRETIRVQRVGGDDPLVFDVVVAEPDGVSRHRVTLSRADAARLGAGAPLEGLVTAAFRFLLDREPKEAILTRFDLSVIAEYFPQFETALPAYLSEAE